MVREPRAARDVTCSLPSPVVAFAECVMFMGAAGLISTLLMPLQLTCTAASGLEVGGVLPRAACY